MQMLFFVCTLPLFFLAPVQEVGCFHLWCSSAKLHGWQRWRLQAGDNWEWESVCLHWLWHCHPKGLRLEAPGGSCHSAAFWRWWVTRKRDIGVFLRSTKFYTEEIKVPNSGASDLSWEEEVINKDLLETLQQNCEDVTCFMLLIHYQKQCQKH